MFVSIFMFHHSDLFMTLQVYVLSHVSNFYVHLGNIIWKDYMQYSWNI